MAKRGEESAQERHGDKMNNEERCLKNTVQNHGAKKQQRHVTHDAALRPQRKCIFANNSLL